MIFSRAIIASLLFASLSIMALASEGQYSYDPADPFGPANWASVNVPNNQCGGMKNSPIAIQSAACDTFQDYELKVSSMYA
jgi:carbonic anhydrase